MSYREKLQALENLSRNGNPALQKERDDAIAALKNKLNTTIGTKTELQELEKKTKEDIRKVNNDYRTKSSAEENTIWEEVKREVERECHVVGNKKAEKCWSKAWESGHSAGYGEVVNHFQDLCELILED